MSRSCARRARTRRREPRWFGDGAHRGRHPRSGCARPGRRRRRDGVPPGRDVPVLGGRSGSVLRRERRGNAERDPRDGAGELLPPRVHEHGRHHRCRARRPTRLRGNARAIRASLRALQAFEVSGRARGPPRGRGRTRRGAGAPDLPRRRGRLRADADRADHRGIPERSDTRVRRHGAQRRARRRRGPRSRARRTVGSTRSQLRARWREHVAPRGTRNSCRRVAAPGADGAAVGPSGTPDRAECRMAPGDVAPERAGFAVGAGADGNDPNGVRRRSRRARSWAIRASRLARH